jgi:hypothetical protein
VETGLLEAESLRQNEIFMKYIVKKETICNHENSYEPGWENCNIYGENHSGYQEKSPGQKYS